MDARLRSLQAKRAIVNAKIEAELTRPIPCNLHLQRLKRQRLRLKDAIHAIVRRFAWRHSLNS